MEAIRSRSEKASTDANHKETGCGSIDFATGTFNFEFPVLPPLSPAQEGVDSESITLPSDFRLRERIEQMRLYVCKMEEG